MAPEKSLSSIGKINPLGTDVQTGFVEQGLSPPSIPSSREWLFLCPLRFAAFQR
jgi:hypothetical protein